jgi:hypothetical protein
MADLGAPSQVNPVVGRHQVEIEAAGNPSDYTHHIHTDVHENREGCRGERDLVADMLILLFEVPVGARTRGTWKICGTNKVWAKRQKINFEIES